MPYQIDTVTIPAAFTPGTQDTREEVRQACANIASMLTTHEQQGIEFVQAVVAGGTLLLISRTAGSNS